MGGLKTSAPWTEATDFKGNVQENDVFTKLIHALLFLFIYLFEQLPISSILAALMITD